MEENNNTLTFTVPSGYKVTIREQNGEDDDVLSNAKHVQNGMTVINFLEGIILEMDGKKPTKEDILRMRIRDRVVILLTTRIFSIGQIMTFEYDWQDGTPKVKYEEDLSLFIWDYSKPFPEGVSQRIKPYKEDKTFREISLSSGKVVKYDYYNAYTENYLMDLPLEKQSINKELLARNLQLKLGGEWVIVQNFLTFSKSDMREIWMDINEYDEALRVSSEIHHPDKDGVSVKLHLMGMTDFFFPARI